MTTETERAALIALLSRPKAKWADVAEEVETAGSALAVLERGTVSQGDLFTPPSSDELDVAAGRLRMWRAEGLSFVSLLDEEYPSQLLTVHQRPPFLMYRGRLDNADRRGVAIVGTRQASADGLRRARMLAAGMAERAVPVVSGLAAGIDTAALTGVLDGGGRPVAVIGTGLHRSYPAANADLQARIGVEGAVISQFFPDAPPTKTSFPMRNAVMSGYAAVTVVIEAAWKSGARMQARLALEHGRPVFLMESLLEHDWARGYATRPAVTVVSSAADVLEHLDQITATTGELVWG